MHVLGIDAGETTTVCLLADEREAVLATSLEHGAILQSSGELEIEKVLHPVMEEALGDRGRPAVVCLGIAGVDRDDDAPGIVIVARTGSIAYGRNSHGVAARACDWDHVIGDEGRGILDRTAGPGRYRARSRWTRSTY